MRAVLAVLGKELREAFRDANVLLYSVAFPLFLYPLLLWGAVQLLVMQAGILERQAPRVEVYAAPELTERLYASPVLPGEGGLEALQAGALDALVEADLPGGAVRLSYRSTMGRSERARELLEERLDEARVDELQRLAEDADLPTDALCPWPIATVDDAPSEEVAMNALARVIPLMALMTLIISIAYPMVEVITGERERGTLETTLVSKVPRGALVAGKLLCAALTGLMAVTGNAVAIWATLSGLVSQSGGGMTGFSDLISAELLLAIFALALLAPAVAAWMGLVLLPARSFKSGQNRSTIVTTLALALAVPCLLPGAEPGWAWVSLPVGGTAMALRGALLGEITIGPVLVTALMNLLIALIGLLLAARVLSREDYLFGYATPRWLAWLENRT